MLNLEKLPKLIKPLLSAHSKILYEVLGSKLVGVYVHGSATTRGFSFEQSDIDYIAVIEGPLTDDERYLLAEKFLEIYGLCVPGNGVEMHIIERKYAGSAFEYPTPFEFHFGTKEQIEYFGKKPNKVQFDYDLAGHLKMLKDRGVCIMGVPINEVFLDISETVFFDSIKKDCEESHESIMEKTPDDDCWVPSYAVLNHCRTLFYMQTGEVCSKIEGGVWALENISAEFKPVIEAALEDKEKPDIQVQINGSMLKRFSSFAYGEIEKHKKAHICHPVSAAPRY